MATQQIHTYYAMCKSRCGVLATVEDGRLTRVTADPEHPNGCICVKGTAAPEIVYSPDRLQYPMLRTRSKGERDPGWVRISWDEAMALTASRLGEIYEPGPSGLTVQQLRQHPMGMRARGTTRYQKYAEIDAATGQPRGFPTPTRKVELYSTHFARAGYAPLSVSQEPVGNPHGHPDTAQEYPLVLTFFRLVQYCDVQHRNIPRLRRQVPEPFLEIHPATAAAVRIQDGEWVILETVMGQIRLKAKFKDSLHPRVVATAHGWWQSCQELGLPGYDPFGPQGSNANLLVSNDVIDPISGSVPHRSQRCRVRKEGISA